MWCVGECAGVMVCNVWVNVLVNVVQLMTMGFTQAACEEAILQTNSLEEATEYLLANPNATPQVR